MPKELTWDDAEDLEFCSPSSILKWIRWPCVSLIYIAGH